ncbi:hypothetical protein I3842_06G175200 [Carya illinoinensis]|uniref:Uncharacterized protein n=1 Tax=Carya illinoinensis TaxID=32201 RepID=A0A922EVD5_CARIL|nr:hypothetical protein I3842_06G175200 [Carya illinoinensis]
MWVVVFMVSNSLGPQADIRVGRQVGLKGQLTALIRCQYTSTECSIECLTTARQKSCDATLEC